MSPIDNFQESLIASASHGTTLALQTILEADDGSTQEAVVLILHHDGKEEESAEESSVFYAGNVAVHSKKMLQEDLSVNIRERLSILDTNTLVCMTGLASDVDFLVRVLQKGVETHRSVHDGEAQAFSKSMLPFQHVHELSRLMQDSCTTVGSRPFGVHALFVGRASRAMKLDVYTVDPGGSLRHWKRGSAAGRKGFAVCKRLSDYRIGDPLEALRMGIEACTQECGSDGHFSAFLLRPSSSTRFIDLNQIHSSQIKGLRPMLE